MRYLFAPLVNIGAGTKIPQVFGTPFSKEELEQVKKDWEVVLDMTNNAIKEGHRPENYPAQDMTVFVSRILASLGIWKPS